MVSNIKKSWKDTKVKTYNFSPGSVEHLILKKYSDLKWNVEAKIPIVRVNNFSIQQAKRTIKSLLRPHYLEKLNLKTKK